MIGIPKCLICKYYLLKKKREDKNTCLAFPDGIPLYFLNETKIHDKVVDGQIGNYVYERK